MLFDERASTTKITLRPGEFESYFPTWTSRVSTLQDLVDPEWEPLSLEHQIFLIALLTKYKGIEDMFDLIMERERRGMNTLLLQKDPKYKMRILNSLMKIPEFSFLFKNEKGFKEIFTPFQQMLIFFAYLRSKTLGKIAYFS